MNLEPRDLLKIMYPKEVLYTKIKEEFYNGSRVSTLSHLLIPDIKKGRPFGWILDWPPNVIVCIHRYADVGRRN